MPWLALSWLLIALAIAVAILLRSRSPWLRLASSVVSMAALTFSLLPLVGSILQPRFSSDPGSFAALSERLFVAAWWLLFARIAVTTGQAVLRVNHRQHAAKLAADLVAGAVYLGAWIAVADLAFGVSVTGLVATSGIIAIVLGLALQSTLGDLFSGIAIGIDRPFHVGDFISIEGGIEGRVIETNWRSTRISTATNDVATVPNSVVAKSRIVNFSTPTETRTATVKVVLDPNVLPIRGVTLLHAAALNAGAPAPHPAPSVVCTELSGDGATYEISFSARIGSFGAARSELLQQVSRHARYAGVALATQNGTPLVAVTAPDVVQLLRETHLLESLTENERTLLAARLIAHRGEAGYALFEQGGARTSLFMVATGAFEMTRDDGRGPQLVGTLGPGDYIGELALLTGAPNVATVRALTPFLVYEVGKAMIAPLLEQNPALLHSLEEGASKAQALLGRVIATQVCEVPAQNSHLLDRIRTFFNAREGEPPKSIARVG
jgi:small-conductance mechanosensitive channel/CRP-like cAMP-binding protein